MADVNKKACNIKNTVENIELTLHCRNNDIIFFKKDKYNKQVFKFHSEIKTWLKSGCQQTTCVTNKTCDAIKK
jgi:hypothetical protein